MKLNKEQIIEWHIILDDDEMDALMCRLANNPHDDDEPFIKSLLAAYRKQLV